MTTDAESTAAEDMSSAAHVTITVMGVYIPPVSTFTSPFKKLCCVSTLATPFSHSLCASTTDGGTRPAIQLCFHISTVCRPRGKPSINGRVITSGQKKQAEKDYYEKTPLQTLDHFNPLGLIKNYRPLGREWDRIGKVPRLFNKGQSLCGCLLLWIDDALPNRPSAIPELQLRSRHSLRSRRHNLSRLNLIH